MILKKKGTHKISENNWVLYKRGLDTDDSYLKFIVKFRKTNLYFTIFLNNQNFSCPWDSFIVWNVLIFEVVKLCKLSNFAGWKNCLEFLWCRYNSILLYTTQLPILSKIYNISFFTLPMKVWKLCFLWLIMGMGPI